jgi:hypothetical protein
VATWGGVCVYVHVHFTVLAQELALVCRPCSPAGREKFPAMLFWGRVLPRSQFPGVVSIYLYTNLYMLTIHELREYVI